jgi:hypothetical protein
MTLSLVNSISINEQYTEMQLFKSLYHSDTYYYIGYKLDSSTEMRQNTTYYEKDNDNYTTITFNSDISYEPNKYYFKGYILDDSKNFDSDKIYYEKSGTNYIEVKLTNDSEYAYEKDFFYYIKYILDDNDTAQKNIIYYKKKDNDTYEVITFDSESVQYEKNKYYYQSYTMDDGEFDSNKTYYKKTSTYSYLDANDFGSVTMGGAFDTSNFSWYTEGNSKKFKENTTNNIDIAGIKFSKSVTYNYCPTSYSSNSSTQPSNQTKTIATYILAFDSAYTLEKNHLLKINQYDEEKGRGIKISIK